MQLLPLQPWLMDEDAAVVDRNGTRGGLVRLLLPLFPLSDLPRRTTDYYMMCNYHPPKPPGTPFSPHVTPSYLSLSASVHKGPPRTLLDIYDQHPIYSSICMSPRTAMRQQSIKQPVVHMRSLVFSTRTGKGRTSSAVLYVKSSLLTPLQRTHAHIPSIRTQLTTLFDFNTSSLSQSIHNTNKRAAG
jgi:hypothetical protein